MVRRLSCVLAVLLLCAAPAGADDSGNRLANWGGEEGLTAWQGMGFASIPYDDSIPRFPAPNFVPGPSVGIGDRLFAASASGVISQTVDLSDLADAIDRGQQPLTFGGLLGGYGGQPGGARLVMQPLDRHADALGDPYILGNPSDRDRQSKTALLPCNSTPNIPAPVGTRAVQIRLEAVGQGLADRLVLYTEIVLTPASLPAPGPPDRVADGPGCSTSERTGPLPPGLADPPVPPGPRNAARDPGLHTLAVVPVADRCGRRGPLRFRVHSSWRSKVKSLAVTARGRRIVRTANKTITVIAPRRSLRVTIRITLRDGRVRTSTRRFVGCIK